MALRFRRRITLAPGVRMNLSGSGVSWSVGPKGASIGTGKTGTYLNAGIGGTGLYARERIGGPRKRPVDPPMTTRVSMQVEVGEGGELLFTDAAGSPIPEHLVEQAKKQKRDEILRLIQQACDEVNQQIEAVAQIHHDTPPPQEKPKHLLAAL